ncbi:GGDEF domain-containing protein, partial [Klebsiella aerogenes]
MPTEQRLDPRQDRAMLWANRENVQKHALSRSMPWLAFVNIAFALMVIFRNVLFTEFDHQSLTHQDIIPYLEMALGAIIVFSLALCMMVISGRILSGIYATKVISAILLILSLCWSVSSYCFIILWSLPFAWPLLVILMTTGLAALYYFPVGLVAYLVPLWGISLLAGVQIHHGVDLRFLIL